MILVTGASGLLGSSVLAEARHRGLEVAGLCRGTTLTLDGVVLRRCDLTRETEVAQIFEELRPTVVIHCAAATNVDWCEAHPLEAGVLNVQSSARIADLAFRGGAQLLHISTDGVFDGSRGDYTEQDPPSPVNVYGRSKLQAEHEVLRACPPAAIPPVHQFGWNVREKQGLAEWVLQQLGTGKTVPGFTDSIFCPILTNDLAGLLLAMVERKLSGTYHVVGKESMSKYEFARRLASVFGFDPARVLPARIADAKFKAARPRDTSLNLGKISLALGGAMPDADSGLRRFAASRPAGFAMAPGRVAGAET